jgi:hypothetical protein
MEGLRLAVFGLRFGPLIGIAAYSLVLAIGAVFWHEIRTYNEPSAA